MQSAQRRQGDALSGNAETHSVVLGVLAGMVVILVARDAPVTATEIAILIIAAACEVMLLRHFLRNLGATARYRKLLARASLSPGFAKQALALGALVVAYLHYYFWDVHLQIASLNSVTVFVPVTAVG